MIAMDNLSPTHELSILLQPTTKTENEVELGVMPYWMFSANFFKLLYALPIIK